MSEITIERATAASAPKVRTGLSRRTRLLSVLALAAGLAAAGYGYRWWSVDRWLETTDDAYVGGDVTPISPHVAGFISAILVRDNQPVRAGELLVKLDDRDFAAALDQAAALLRGRQATLDGLRAKDGLQAAVIRQAEADLAAKKAQALFAHEDAIRYGNLARTSAGSQQNAQKSAAADEEAQAAVIASQAALDGARQQLAVLAAAITEAEATVAQAEADVKTARLNLGYTEIRSPIDGYIGNRAAQIGAYVSAGAYLVTIIPAHGLWIDANFKEDQLARMRPGDAATVITDIAPGHVLHGRIASLAPATGAIFSVIPPENATGNFTKIVQRVPVRIAFDADGPGLERLRPGLSTTVTVDTQPN